MGATPPGTTPTRGGTAPAATTSWSRHIFEGPFTPRPSPRSTSATGATTTMPSRPTWPFRPIRPRAAAAPRRLLPTGARTSARQLPWSVSCRRWGTFDSPRGSSTSTATRPT
eukprot:8716182-Lingulodinium_polyedra.AAC.1